MNIGRLLRESRTAATCVMLVALSPAWVQAKKKAWVPGQQLSEYIQQVTQTSPPESRTLGSLWNPQAPFANLARDFKAERVGDVVIIRIAEQTSSQTSGTVKTARSLSAQSGISQLLGQVGPKSGLQNIFSPNSTEALNGQGQTASSSTLATSLTGTVTQVLSNGYLVVKAVREVEIDNQRQQVVLKGIVRPGDIAPDNSIPSTSIGDVVVEVAGKGVISDGTRPPNRLTRLILKLVGF